MLQPRQDKKAMLFCPVEAIGAEVSYTLDGVLLKNLLY